MVNNKKSWFTLVEVVLACSIFAIVVIWIMAAINRSYAFMNNIKLSVRATNLAREWMEMMYNIRDTNRRRQSWNRDKYRLSVGKLTDISPHVLDGTLFEKWIYILKEDEKDGNKYIYAKKLNLGSVNEDSFYNDGFWDSGDIREKTKLNFSWKYSYYERDEHEKKEKNIQDAMVWQWLEFYRIVRVFGIYCKNSNDPNQTVSNTNCKNDSDPKEMRFCVKVFYSSQWKHSTELCGVITNFTE